MRVASGVLVAVLLLCGCSSSSDGGPASSNGGSGGAAACTVTGTYDITLTRSASMPGSCSGSTTSTAELQITADASGYVVRAGLCTGASPSLVFASCSANVAGCMVSATCDDPCTGARKHDFSLQISGNTITGTDAVNVLQDPGPGCTENDAVAGTRK